MDPWRAHRKFSRAIRVIKLRISPDILGRPPRQRPPDRYLQSSDQPLRRQRSTVAGWTISRLSRQFGHHPRQQDPSQSIPQTKTWAAGSAPLQHRNLMAQCDRFQRPDQCGSGVRPFARPFVCRHAHERRLSPGVRIRQSISADQILRRHSCLSLSFSRTRHQNSQTSTETERIDSKRSYEDSGLFAAFGVSYEPQPLVARIPWQSAANKFGPSTYSTQTPSSRQIVVNFD